VIDVSVAATVIAACVGAAAVLVGAYLTNSLGRRLKQGVQERRLAAYEGLWAVTGVAATIRLRGEWAGGPLTEKERRELFDAMTKWYYRTSGGIFLSPSRSFLASSIKVGVTRANGVLPKVQRASWSMDPAAALPGHLQAGQLGNTLAHLEMGH
jgi:hypothetical protein